MAQLCGDDVASIVADLGTHSCKFGFAGQDSPRWVSKSNCALVMHGDSQEITVGEACLRVARENVEVLHPFSQGINWELVENIFVHTTQALMRSQFSDFPFLVAEGAFTQTQDKQQLVELLIEQHASPAVYIANNAVLSSFCAGRPTSLVGDFSASGIRFTPVVDGYALRSAARHTPRGGDWLEGQLLAFLLSKGVNIVPRHELATCPVSVRESFRGLLVKDIVQDLKHCICRVPERHLGQDMAEINDFLTYYGLTTYELPDGTHVNASFDLVALPEKLLFPTETHQGRSKKRTHQQTNLQNEAYEQNESIAELAYSTVLSSDVDVRKELLQTVLCMGGGSLMQGTPQRLQTDLTNIAPGGMKVKVHTMLPVERQFSTWIGGSILAQCGSFQQMWLSKKEYEEEGERAIGQRFCF